MKTSILAADLYDVMQLLLEKLGLDKEHTVNDIGTGFKLGAKYENDGKDYLGTFVSLRLRSKDIGGVHAMLEIPIDYRTHGGLISMLNTYEAWDANRKK